MNTKEIEKVEIDLALVREMSDRDQRAFETSDRPLIDKIFLASSDKRRKDLEKKLFYLKSERAHELISLRLMGNQLTGSIRLRSLVKIVEPLNALLEKSAWRFWDKDGVVEKIDDHFSNLLDLRLAGIEAGSTELVVVGNTAPDLTGESALEEGLKNIFTLLTSSNDEFSNHIHDVGLPACKAMSSLMDVLEKQNIAAEFSWSAPDKVYEWQGRPAEITRIKAILEDIGEPSIKTEKFRGVVQVLSVRNRIEIFSLDSKSKISANYHRSLSDEINELHLGDQREFVVEKTVYPFHIGKKKKDAYTLKSIHLIDLSDI